MKTYLHSSIILKISVIFSIVAGAFLYLTPSSYAHTSPPISMSPMEGAEIESLPEKIMLGFSEDLVQAGAALSVLDPSGAQLVIGLPEISGKTLTGYVKESIYKGEYSITYRVTSSDGAVNQGKYYVYIINGEEYVATSKDAVKKDAPDTSDDYLPNPSRGSSERTPTSSYILLLLGGVMLGVGSLLYFKKSK